MINDLKNYRALLYLGHKSDIFTLTAEEAIKLGIPVVTYGIGSLADRVVHGVSGFVCGNEKEFSHSENKKSACPASKEVSSCLLQF